MASPDRRSDWARVLDTLEAEALSSGAPQDEASGRVDEPWLPELGVGALPAELLDRAREVLALQRDTLDRLRLEQGSIRRHLGALRTIPEPREHPAIYLDTQG